MKNLMWKKMVQLPHPPPQKDLWRAHLIAWNRLSTGRMHKRQSIKWISATMGANRPIWLMDRSWMHSAHKSSFRQFQAIILAGTSQQNHGTWQEGAGLLAKFPFWGFFEGWSEVGPTCHKCRREIGGPGFVEIRKCTKRTLGQAGGEFRH